MALLHILRWLDAHHPADLQLLLLGGGELEEQYRTIVPTMIRTLVPERRSARTSSFVHRVLRRVVLGNDRSLADALAFVDLGVDLIYANTVATLGALSTLAARHPVPAICHVHELEMGIRANCGADTFRRARRDVETYIAASRAVADNLRTTHRVEPERIRQVYEAIPIGAHDRAATAAVGARTRRELDIPHEAFVVGGCGTMDWRKAPEVFLQIASRVARSDLGRAAHFVWIGGTSSGAPIDGLRYDVRRLGLDGSAHFVGPQKEPARYFAMFDAFLLSSREDPFPLVCLEAASLEVPSVCFADAGGMAELIEEDAGFVVPYLDIERAAECLVAMGRSESLRSGLGTRAAEKVRAAHDIEVVGRQIASLLDAHLQRPALTMG